MSFDGNLKGKAYKRGAVPRLGEVYFAISLAPGHRLIKWYVDLEGILSGGHEGIPRKPIVQTKYLLSCTNLPHAAYEIKN